MFHKRKGQIAAMIILLGGTAQPILSYADESPTPVVIMEPDRSPNSGTTEKSIFKDFSLEEFRSESKKKLWETQLWIEAKTEGKENPIKALGVKIDRLQDQVKPAGQSLKSSLKKRMPGRQVAHTADQTISVYGILLVMAFAIVFFLMALSSPTSRLGGRH